MPTQELERAVKSSSGQHRTGDLQKLEGRSLNPSAVEHPLIRLQRRFGNRYVQGLLAAVRRAEDEQSFSLNLVGMATPAKPSVVKTDLQPHQGSEPELRALAPIYKQGKTPIVSTRGEVQVSDVQPANTVSTGRHLDRIFQRFGHQGLDKTLWGLTITRGVDFMSLALRQSSTAIQSASTQKLRAANVGGTSNEDLFAIPAAPDRLAQTSPSHANQEGRAGRLVAALISRSGPGHPLPEAARTQLARSAGDDLRDVRVHTDGAADTAARLLGARAFAVGRSIFFAAQEYQPASTTGLHLLAHEVAHTVQQRGATMPALENLRVGAPSDHQEAEAENFAESTAHPNTKPESLSLTQFAKVARIQRVISFARSNNHFGTNPMGVGESAAGFQIRPTAFPLFDWTSDITINGNAGDPFTDFEVGPLQVVRTFAHTVDWGTGANHTRRRVSLSALPIRDATAAANIWYHDPLAHAFTGRGNTQNTGLNDSPQSSLHPWANPVAGRVGNSGSFHYEVAFVAYISARDTTRAGAAAFRAIACVYWNTAINGTFDGSQPPGSRVTSTGGALNRSGVIEGGSAEVPMMHGGAIANSSVAVTDT